MIATTLQALVYISVAGLLAYLSVWAEAFPGFGRRGGGQ